MSSFDQSEACIHVLTNERGGGHMSHVSCLMCVVMGNSSPFGLQKRENLESCINSASNKMTPFYNSLEDIEEAPKRAVKRAKNA